MTEEHRFPCDQCGADMRFAPAEGKLICDHCGNERRLEESYDAGAIRELDFRAALEARLPEAEIEETRVARCPNCGAQVEFDEAEHARECPFCATPMVIDTGAHRHIKPRGLLPFALTEAEARRAMTDWLGRLWFAPGGLQEYARKGRRMDGIYVPFWTFDADTSSDYRGERGTVYYVTRTVTRNGKTRQVREPRVRWTPARGRVRRFFDDVLVLASTSLPRKHTDGLEPWDLTALRPYSPEYLAGFRAEAYQVELNEGFTQARAHMDRVIERDVRFDIGGDRQRIHGIETQISEVTFKHVLLPVWLAAYRYRGRSYRFVVNGTTGRVQGERPYSKWKIAVAVLLGLILAAVLGWFAAQNQ
jgi:Zn finger protein HypA/HybF involved in hydrogenase expression